MMRQAMRKAALAMAISMVVAAPPVGASGIPTVDIVANIRGALDFVEQTLQTIESKLQTINQFTQIDNQIQSLFNEAQQAAREIQNMTSLPNRKYADYVDQWYRLKQVAQRVGALSYATDQLIAQYEQYKDVDYYKNNMASLTKATFDNAMVRWNTNSMQTAKAAADVMHQQAQLMEAESADLYDMNLAAAGVTGHMQAMQAGNQLASFNAQQLMHVRSLMLNQQQMEIQDKAQSAEREAITTIRSEKFLSPRPNNTASEGF